MEPFMTPRQRAAAFLSTPATILLPSAIGLLAASRTPGTARALAVTLGAFAGAAALTSRRYVRGRVPLSRWPLLAVVAFVTPVQSALSLLGSDEIEWRGQRLRVRRDGQYELVA
jgi:hypothetical protein